MYVPCNPERNQERRGIHEHNIKRHNQLKTSERIQFVSALQLFEHESELIVCSILFISLVNLWIQRRTINI